MSCSISNYSQPLVKDAQVKLTGTVHQMISDGNLKFAQLLRNAVVAKVTMDVLVLYCHHVEHIEYKKWQQVDIMWPFVVSFTAAQPAATRHQDTANSGSDYERFWKTFVSVLALEEDSLLPRPSHGFQHIHVQERFEKPGQSAWWFNWTWFDRQLRITVQSPTTLIAWTSRCRYAPSSQSVSDYITKSTRPFF